MNFDNLHELINRYEAKIDLLYGKEHYELFKWCAVKCWLDHIKEELADVLVYCRNLLDELGLDEDEIINAKMTQNEAKYPVEKARGSAAKYDRLADDKKAEG